MKMSTWYKPAILYVIDLNGMTKFGITTNWRARRWKYERDFPGLPLTEIKKFQFEKRWQAELIEQLLSRRLKGMLMYGRYEWVYEVHIQHVLDCLYQIRQVIQAGKEMDRSSTIHMTGSRRFGYYDQLFDILEDKFEAVDLKLDDVVHP